MSQLDFRYAGCRWPFPHRITGDGYARLMYKPPGPPINYGVDVVGIQMRKIADEQIRQRNIRDGKLLPPPQRPGENSIADIEAAIRAHWGQLSVRQIARALGVSKGKIKYRAEVMGLIKRHYRPWEPDEIEYLKENFGYEHTRKIGFDLGRSEMAVRLQAETMGLKGKVA